MLHLSSSRSNGRMCDGLSRRDFLSVGALGLGGLTLADIARLKAQGALDGSRSDRSVLLVFLSGGPSHIDMYDLKPNAPAEIRGEFAPIATNVPGVDVCELMPRHARLAHRYSVVNGVQTQDTHSAWAVMSGSGEKDRYPVFGSFVSRLRGATRDGMPTYVAIGGENSSDPGEPGFLGSSHRPFKPSGDGLANMGRLREVTLERLADRRTLQQSLDTLSRSIDDVQGNVSGYDEYVARGLDILAGDDVRSAFDLKREDPNVVERYGRASRLLLGLRLALSGVSVTTLSMAGTIIPHGDWDTHAGTDQKTLTNFQSLRAKLPVYDHAVATLLEDLYARGADEKVLVVICGEFGRTPRINKNGGRDHWAPAGSVLFAGGGLQMGQTIGDTGRHAERDEERAYNAQSVLAVIYRHLGLDPETTTIPDLNGRPRYLLDDRRLIRELI